MPGYRLKVISLPFYSKGINLILFPNKIKSIRVFELRVQSSGFPFSFIIYANLLIGMWSGS